MARIVISMPSESRDVVLPKLDGMAAGVARVKG